MKEPKEFIKSFPEIGELIDNAAKQVQAIEEQIKWLSKDNPPQPHLKPQGAPPIRPNGTRAQNIAILKQKIIDIQNTCKKDVEGRITNVDVEEQAGVKGYMNERFQLSKDDKEKYSKADKRSNADALIATLPFQKIKTEDLYKENAEKITKPKTDTTRNLLYAESSMESLTSSRIGKEFKDNAREITKDMD